MIAELIGGLYDGQRITLPDGCPNVRLLDRGWRIPLSRALVEGVIGDRVTPVETLDYDYVDMVGGVARFVLRGIRHD